MLPAAVQPGGLRAFRQASTPKPAGVSGKCGSGPGGIEAELRKLLAAADRFDYRPDLFAQSLAAINKKLFK